MAIAISVAIGLSIPAVAAYSGNSSGLGFFGNMMGWRSTGSNNNLQQQQSSYYPTGMTGGGYGYGGGMMGSYYGGGMMGGYNNNGSYYDMMTIQGQSVLIQQAIQSALTPPTYAQVTKSNDTISFHSQTINVFALAIMPDGAVNLTGGQLPSYSSGDVFVIYGLINPTLVIPAGASVQFTIANLDTDMYHNLVVSSISPPYPYMAMQGMMSSSYSAPSYLPAMMGFLPPANYSQSTAHEYSYAVTFNQAGNLWYLCTYPGHAQSGMYGRIFVEA